MKLKLLKNVVIGRAVAKAGQIIDANRTQAESLIERGLASENIITEELSTKARMLAEYATATADDLKGMKASAEKALAKDPNRQDAKTAIEVADELLAKK